MVWTSVLPKNAALMVAATFRKDERKKLLAVWARDTLGLTAAQYNAKVQVYKSLTRIWEGEHMVHHPTQPGLVVFDQTNTVLLDDTATKAVENPYNLIHLPEFLGGTGSQAGAQDDVLAQCTDYLEEARHQSNVSAFVRTHPFTFVPGTRKGSYDEGTI